jgi:hypothetical protein
MDQNRRLFLQMLPLVALAPRVAAISGQGATEAGRPLDALTAGFRSMPQSSRLIMHWYIFGPAWTEQEALRQLRFMKDAHIGGTLIFPTYPVAVDDPARGVRNQRYLDDDFFRVLNATLAGARELGMTVDLVIGTGWPYGGPSVTERDAARALRMRLGASPDLKPSEKLVATIGEGEAVKHFYSAPTGMQVKRAALGAEGLVLDHYSPGALTRYLEAVAGEILKRVPASAIRSFFCDSLEVYRANWTDDMPRIFRERRGYDLIPHLPALFDAADPHARDVRCDFWRTCSEQAVDGFIKPLQQWLNRRGALAQVEAYGTPPVSLAAFRNVDIPVGEHYEWKEFSSSRWASSGGRLAGKRLIMAEAWTWLGLPDRFSDSLEQLKLCSDLHFLCGINALYGVTYAYSPIDFGAPGWPPYFGPVVNHTQPYWPYFSHFSDYVNRASYLLQQGRPIAEIALYLPAEDCMAEAGPEQLMLNWVTRDRMSSNGAPPEFSLKNALHYQSDVIAAIIAGGYCFDGVDTFTINDGMNPDEGRLRMGDGDYGALILPNLTAIDVASLEKIAHFVREGGALIATKRLPETAYGLLNREENRRRVKQLIAEIFGAVSDGAGLHINSYGKGLAALAGDEQGSLREALRRLVSPAIAFREQSPHIGFVHRRTDQTDIYFLANTSSEPVDLRARFHSNRPYATRWDLLTGEIFEVPSALDGDDLLVPLGPFESCAVVLTSQPLSARRTHRVETNGRHAIKFGRAVKNETVSGLPAPLELTAPWRVAFRPPLSKTMTLERLASWTEIPEARYFSGVAIYETKFDLPPLPARTGSVLKLGRVCETVSVSVNGLPAGVSWMRPYEIDVTKLLRAGENSLRIEVSNLLINKVLGDGPIDYSEVRKRFGNRFPAGEEWTVVREPRVSGLLGPVRLAFYRDLFSSS